MLNCLGVTENFAAIENIAWVSNLSFFDDSICAPYNIDGITFEGAVYTGEDRTPVEMAIQKVDASTIQVTCPGLPFGRWPYELYAVADTGAKERVISGYMGVMGAVNRQQLETGKISIRTLAVRLPGNIGQQLRLEWLAGSYAVTAADNAEKSAKAAAASAVLAAGSATQASESATDARNTQSNINAIIQQAIAAATLRAETAANNAAQSALQAAATLEECQSVRDQTHDLLGQAQYVLTQCRGVYNEILALIETGAVGDAITAATGNILEEILTDSRLTNRFVAAMSGSGAFVLFNNLGRALTVNPLGMVDVDLSNYSGTVVSINGTTSATIKSGTTASLTLSAGAAALYGGTSASITHTNDNKITLYNYGGSTGNVCSIVSNRIDGRGTTGIQLRISATESGSNVPSFSMYSSSTSFFHPSKNAASPAFTTS